MEELKRAPHLLAFNSGHVRLCTLPALNTSHLERSL